VTRAPLSPPFSAKTGLFWTYNSDDQILSESVLQLSDRLVAHTYDTAGRRATATLSLGAVTLVTWPHTCNDKVHLASVSDLHHDAAVSQRGR
jgi:hypothetical protein